MTTVDIQEHPKDEEGRTEKHPHLDHESLHHGHVHGDGPHATKQMSQEDVVHSLLLLGQLALNASDYESAADAYASALELGQDEAALYNLGSLYARGLGVKRDFVEGARLFHQAELLGNERAGMLCRKCMFDYVCEGVDEWTPADVYAAMAVFVSRVYPEAADKKAEVIRGLQVVAATLSAKGAHAEATKVLHVATTYQSEPTS